MANRVLYRNVVSRYRLGMGKGLSLLHLDILAVLELRSGWSRPKHILDALGRKLMLSNRVVISKALKSLCHRELIDNLGKSYLDPVRSKVVGASMTKPMDDRERAIRTSARHLGLMVRGHDGILALYEPYGEKRRKIGEYRAWADIERDTATSECAITRRRSGKKSAPKQEVARSAVAAAKGGLATGVAAELTVTLNGWPVPYRLATRRYG